MDDRLIHPMTWNPEMTPIYSLTYLSRTNKRQLLCNRMRGPKGSSTQYYTECRRNFNAKGITRYELRRKRGSDRMVNDVNKIHMKCSILQQAYDDELTYNPAIEDE